MSERVPEPLEMSDTEILDWLNEYCNEAGTTPFGSWFIHQYSENKHYGESIRLAVCKAAAHHKEANRDF